jgi:exosortase
MDKDGNPAGSCRMNNGNEIDNTSSLYEISTPQRMWLKAGLLAAIFLIVYLETILLFVSTWLGRDDYSHGFLVPVISLYFVWHKRAGLRRLPIQPSVLSGLLVTLAGGLMLIMGKISGTAIVQQLSIIVVVPGLVLMLLGGNFLKALALPLSYLILMVPVLDVVIDKIHWPFQLFSATIAASLLKIINIPVFQNANYLELPNITLEVANACSGVRYLISIMAIAIPLAFLTLREWRRRALLVLSAVVVGILANPIRITLAGIWT